VKTVKVGICGLGTVGGGTLNVLQRNATEIARRIGTRIEVVHVAARSVNPQCDTTGITVTDNALEVVANPEVEVVGYGAGPGRVVAYVGVE